MVPNNHKSKEQLGTIMKDLRQPISINIYYRGRRSFPVATHDINIDGMFLLTRSLSIPLSTKIEIEIATEDYHCRLPAIVTDNCADGIGVMFAIPQPNLLKACRIG